MNRYLSDKNRQTVYTIAWFFMALFYAYQYILRIAPGIMVVELREVFQLTAQEFSSLGSIYLFSYSLLQIPLGFILDRLGVKRVILAAMLLCIAGTILFVSASNVLMLQMGRFLIGLGSAPAFICALKCAHDHLPSKYRGFFMGATLSVGTLGALLSGRFLVTLLDSYGWQDTILLCAGLGGVLLLLMMAIIPGHVKKTKASQNVLSNFREGMRVVLKQKSLMIYAIIAISVYTPLCVLADLWGTAFLMEKFSLERAMAAQLSLYLYGGLTLGSLLLPGIVAKWGQSKAVIQLCVIGLSVTLAILLYAQGLGLWQLGFLMAMIGVFCGAEMLCFAGAVEQCPISHSGLALGVVNTLNMLGGALMQQAIGGYLDFQWRGVYSPDGSRFYGADELTTAFSLLLVIILSCGLLSIFLVNKRKESKSHETPIGVELGGS